jgi:hypothetical protein
VSLKETKKEAGEFELDESYFGANRTRGVSLKKGGKVFVKIVAGYSKQELTPVTQGKTLENRQFAPTGGKHITGWF